MTRFKLKNCLNGLFIFATLMAHAQQQRRDWLLEGSMGNLSFTNNKLQTGLSPGTESKNLTFSIGPSAGYFISKGVMLGATIRYDFLRDWIEILDSQPPYYSKLTKATALSFMPVLRTYLVNRPKNRVYLQLGAGLSYNINKLQHIEQASPYYLNRINRSDIVYKSQIDQNNAEALLGYNYFFTPNAAITTNAGIRYSHQVGEAAYTSDSNSGSGSYNYVDSINIESAYIFWNIGVCIVIKRKEKVVETM